MSQDRCRYGDQGVATRPLVWPYHQGWSPVGKPVKERHKEEFCGHVPVYFTKEADLEAEASVRGVFKVLSRRMTEGEIENIKHILPPELRDLWP